MRKFSIPQCIQEDLREFDILFKKEITSSVTIVNIVSKYVLKTKGKQLRPIVIFLTARMIGNVTKSTFSAAYMVELMHTATLIHDDVVDNADKRRGFFSINALWKNKFAVLIGDYFLSKGLIYALENNELTNLEIISNAVKQMSEGELLQIDKAKNGDNTEHIYFEIIRKKTATLFIAAMTAAAKSTQICTNEQLANIEKLAELLGIAFQIKDDLLDYTSTNIIGKPAWNDLRERKMTLPLLYALSNSEKQEQRKIKKLLKTHSNKTEELQKIVDFVKEKSGLTYTEKRLQDMCSEAIAICNTFKESDARTALIDVIQFIQYREN